MTPPTTGWLCDPQRPLQLGGTTHLYYLHSDQNNAPGWWQHATTTDLVRYSDAGVAIPLGPDFPAWTGSLVVDTANTSGLGAGTIVALVTRPTGGDRFDQEQYLYHSHDGGHSFTAWGAPVAQLLGVSTAETVRKWVRQVQVDQGARPGVTSEESAEVRRLKRDNAELRRANSILKAAAAFFEAELDRPSR